MRAGGGAIPVVTTIRVLGLFMQAHGRNGNTIHKLEACVQQTMRLISRIANRHSGMKEANLIRLVQAFVLSRITYITPYLCLKAAEREKIEGIIRRAYKQALGLPIRTADAKLLALGVHNTLDELVEAHLISQYERLAQSAAGRNILQNLGINYESMQSIKVDIPHDQRRHLKINPLPKTCTPNSTRKGGPSGPKLYIRNSTPSKT